MLGVKLSVIRNDQGVPAIEDFKLAEQRGFGDLYTLMVARGNTYRQLDMPAEALMDFITASDVLGSSKKVEKIRIEMLKALCVIGVKDYNSALKMILSSLDLVKDCKAKSRTGGDTSLPPSIPGPGPGPVPGMEGLESYQSREFTPHTGIPEQSSAGCSVQGEAHRGNTSLSPTDFTLLMRCEWILSYHSALCSYHTGRYAKALQMINRCIEKETPPVGPDPRADPGLDPVPPNSSSPVEGSLLAYAPEEADIGATLFFKGVSLSHLGRLGEALSCFLEAAQSTWAVKAATAPRVLTRTSFMTEQARRDSGRERNRMICYFAIAKVHQREKKHTSAVEYFTKAFETLPHDKDVAFVLFRRAWSYKAMSNFTFAGDDFETAKQLKKDDPNFNLEYKRIAQCEYMEFTTEPDLVEPFPPLQLSSGRL